MSEKYRNTIRNSIRILSVFATIALDVFVFVLGNYQDSYFKILQYETTNEGIIYSINNSALVGVLTLFTLNIFIIYNEIITHKLKESGKDISKIINNHVNEIDRSGLIAGGVDAANKGLSRVQVHLINYDENTLHFNNLSAIESEIGTDKESIHNEIWILTNNFEESHDSKEGQEIRTAMLINLRHNVDYFYIIPSAYLGDVNELTKKLTEEANGEPITGRFSYITDDALDFIPTAYFDIIMYIQTGKNPEYTEKNSQIYYCFSRITDTEDYYYQKVKEKEIWERMMKKKEDYKKNNSSAFVTILGPITKATVVESPPTSVFQK